MFVSPSVRLSLSLYTYIHIYILILYTYYVRFVRSAIWGPFILRPICIGRCLPQGYSQWGAEFFTSTEIHGFPVDPLQSSRSQVHATGVAVSEGLAEKGWVGRCLHLVIYIHTHTNISHSTCIWLYMYICIQSYIYMHSIYIYICRNFHRFHSQSLGLAPPGPHHDGRVACRLSGLGGEDPRFLIEKWGEP